MSTGRADGFLAGLVAELRKQSSEASWFEFKVDHCAPEDIGEYISALSNAAALEGKVSAYIVWGIEASSHAVVGTTFNPNSAKKGNEDLESWLARLLSPRVHFQFHHLEYEDKHLVILEIPSASGRPVQFQGVEYIRVGSYRQKMKDHPQLEKALWRAFETTPFEAECAADHLEGSALLGLLDYPSFFELLKVPLPSNRDAILARLADDRMIVADDAGGWNLTNLGAVLFGRELEAFPHLRRKSTRVVVYDGKGRLKAVRERVGRKGYAAGFLGLIRYLNELLPRNEVMGEALRKEVPMYPEVAIRELVANALIHQDFSLTGAGPMIEVFEDRMEISNPGTPLMNTDRFLDTAPRSRNEALASFMRRVGICEERGSGVDKVVFETEFFQLPAPIFETPGVSTRAVLFAHRKLREMGREDRVRACYLHACLRFVQRDPMTNSSLRARFGIEERNAATASRIIRDALEDERIKPYEAGQAKRYSKYLPWWA